MPAENEMVTRSGSNGVATATGKRGTLPICLALLTAVFAVYWQTGTHEFINFDDVPYVTGNQHVQAGLNRDSITWAFTATTEANWHPLTWLSHMADCHLFGLNPAGHHLMSVFLHAANTLLLFFVLLQCTGRRWQSAFVGALFALHPLHVESVAWAAERKDVLSTLFWLLTMGAYVAYVSRPAPWRYLLTLLLFSLGLMAKPMLVTLPLVLLLFDYWPLGRTLPFRRLLLEKLPLLALSGVSSIITYLVQHKDGAVASLNLVPLPLRLENALVSCLRYLGKTIWPTELAVFYPFRFDLPLWQAGASALLLFAITLSVLTQRRRYPYLLTGWFWYLITLVPVIGIVQVGSQSMADRYTYVPLVGIFIAVAWGGAELLKGHRWKPQLVATTAVGLLAVFALTAYGQVGYWRDSIKLYKRSIAVTGVNPFLHDNLASAYLQKGLLAEAIEEANLALRIDPAFFKAHFILGLIYDRQNEIPSAIYHYREAVRLNPSYIVALNNLGRDLAITGELESARDCFTRVLQLDPGNRHGENNLAFVLGKLAKARKTPTNGTGR